MPQLDPTKRAVQIMDNTYESNSVPLIAPYRPLARSVRNEVDPLPPVRVSF